MDIKLLHKKATQSADTFIRGITDEDWNKQSTCTDWTVRELVNHLVNENLWVPELLKGKTVAEVGNKLDGDLLGNNPIKKWGETCKAALEAVDNLADVDQICHLSYADVPCSEYINQRILDLTVHGWDVARSTGQPDQLDEELVSYVYATFSHREKELRGSGMFGKNIKVSASSGLQTKLLALLGRKR